MILLHHHSSNVQQSLVMFQGCVWLVLPNTPLYPYKDNGENFTLIPSLGGLDREFNGDRDIQEPCQLGTDHHFSLAFDDGIFRRLKTHIHNYREQSSV